MNIGDQQTKKSQNLPDISICEVYLNESDKYSLSPSWGEGGPGSTLATEEDSLHTGTAIRRLLHLLCIHQLLPAPLRVVQKQY